MHSKDGRLRDLKVEKLYSLATTSVNKDLRREALRYLGALKRAGSPDAAWAVEQIRKDSK